MARPLPPHDRRILCTSCGGLLVVAYEAKSVNCSHCHQRVICEALVIRDYVAVRRLRTANTVHITKKGNVLASIWCESLTVDGRLKGEAIALERMTLTRKAEVQGDLRAMCLTVEEGAILSGTMRIGPEHIPQHDAGPQPAAALPDDAEGASPRSAS
ncbi:MAG: polymer-forming cytoskeletal protein [Planctomycetota bacterium]|nr:polymer-forming cytoskeletal protein [Planctomycetota bacterium]